MCSSFQPIKNHHANWVKLHFDCELPDTPWHEEVYPTYPAPFIYLDKGKPRCELAQFGLVPHWATDKKKFGLRTYNARRETVQEKPSYRAAWKERRFGLVLMESFYEPNWETGKALRWRIKRADGEPMAAASIWERSVDDETGEINISFSMLTINAEGHEVMKHFHKPEDEKRSVVVLNDSEFQPWLHASHNEAIAMLNLAPSGCLVSEAAPR
ncbi:MAG: SOS response-associated peptidase [Methylotenera sp.]